MRQHVFQTHFNVATHYEIQVVGSEQLHQELWVPAEDLEAFNAAIVGGIEVVAAYTGPQFGGMIDPVTHLPDFGDLQRP